MLSDVLPFIELSFFAATILFLLRYAGFVGLCVFATIAILICNIQVLREAQFCFQAAPVALGTIMCSLAFLTSDIITEHYGAKAAKLSAYLSFVMQIIFVVAMQMTLAYQPQTDTFFQPLQTVFSPMPRLFFASIGTYLLTQLLDIYLFATIKRYLPAKKWLWLRSFGATSIASFADTIIFSTLAWYILAPSPCSVNKLIWTYILGTTVFRVFVIAWSTPIIYLSYRFKKMAPVLPASPQDMTMPD